MYRVIISFFTEGTRPIRAIEGILLISSMLIASYFPFFYGIKGMVAYAGLAIAIISYLAFVHLKGCRGFYEMYLLELETLVNDKETMHRFMISLIKIYEYYLLIYSFVIAIISILSILNILYLEVQYLIAFSAISYAIISFTGHTTRLLAFRKMKRLERNPSF